MHLGMVGSSFKGIKIAGLAVLFTVLAAFNPRPFRAANAGVNIIVIDPGHGGKDPGNLGTGRYRSREKDVSFDVSQLVKKYIEENLPDTKVILTRDDDQFIELYQRTVIANRANADVFISIHCNANDNKSAYGTESFVLGMGEKDQRLNKTAQLENAARLLEENWESNYEELNANNPAAIIALRAYQDAFLEQSISIADEIQRQFEGRVKRRNRGVKQQPLAVLRGSTMPAVLVELGFLTNPGEEDFLQSAQGKELLASAIYRAVKEYKFKREQRDAGIQTEGSSLTPSVYIPSNVPTATEEQPAEAAAEVRTEEMTREATPETVESSEMDLFFAVQIAVSRNDLPCLPENFKGVESVWKQEQYGLYKYYCGKLATFTDAEALKQNVVAQYPDAYLVAFEKDKKIDLNEAKKRAP
ncbi:MAG: N-acetylmuramoyl-L-alanine amidase [Bacteroidetes bacterium]|nr:N-acetylmuramoyl-L-alanine amidase [Bacteroidota bacterium]